MKRFGIIGLLLFSFIFLSAVCHADYREGYLLVRFSQTGTSPAANAARQAVVDAAGGGTIEKMYPIVPGLGLVKLPDGTTVTAAQTAFSLTPGVCYSEPDYLGQWAKIPNDTRFDELWGSLEYFDRQQ